jgi:hypothetical protein
MIFVSYSSADATVAKALATGLDQLGCQVWLDSRQIPVGVGFVQAIGSALDDADLFLVIDTPTAANSYWVSNGIEPLTRIGFEELTTP